MQIMSTIKFEDIIASMYEISVRNKTWYSSSHGNCCHGNVSHILKVYRDNGIEFS